MPQTRPTTGGPISVGGVRRLGLVALGGVLLSTVYATKGLGIPCPFLTLTGWRCPFCGGTRLGAALLRGEVAVAFGLNPLVFVGLVIAGLLAVVWLIEAAGGPALRLPAGWARRVRRIGPWGWLVVAGVGLTLWTVVRNLV